MIREVQLLNRVEVQGGGMPQLRLIHQQDGRVVEVQHLLLTKCRMGTYRPLFAMQLLCQSLRTVISMSLLGGNMISEQSFSSSTALGRALYAARVDACIYDGTIAAQRE